MRRPQNLKHSSTCFLKWVSNVKFYGLLTISEVYANKAKFLIQNQTVFESSYLKTINCLAQEIKFWLLIVENTFSNLLYIQKWESDCFPKIISIFTSDFEMFIPLFFDQRIILDRHSVPHIVFLKKKIKKWHKKLKKKETEH